MQAVQKRILLTSYIGVSLLFGIILGVMLTAYDDGEQFALYKKIRCKIGWHKIRTKLGQARVNSYYCQFCKKPRKHPTLKMVEGGKKKRYKK